MKVWRCGGGGGCRGVARHGHGTQHLRHVKQINFVGTVFTYKLFEAIYTYVQNMAHIGTFRRGIRAA